MSMNGDRRGNGHWRPDPGGGRGVRANGGYSGRRFLLLAGLLFLALWTLLFLGFRRWRFHYRERADYGLKQVAPAIDGLLDVAPAEPGLSPDAWKDAVRDTHAMLDTVVGANLLDLDRMKELRGELESLVARSKAHPETALAELASLWDRMADRAEFLLAEKERHPRPKILPPRKDHGGE